MIWFAGKETLQSEPESFPVLRGSFAEQRHRRAEFQIVERAENLMGGTVRYLRIALTDRANLSASTGCRRQARASSIEPMP